jgi:hypothetical protein
MQDPQELYEQLRQGDVIDYRDPTGQRTGLVQGRTPRGLL